CSMPGVENAVSVARVVMEETPHVLVAGRHAVDLARDFDIEADVDLSTPKTREKWGQYGDNPKGRGMKEHIEWLRDKFGGTDTVGGVAYDGDEFAAATSTGGRWFALRGRVGDVPQIGSGFYASSAGGASTTGAGEDIARVTLTRRAVQYLENGMNAQEAADAAIQEFDELTGSRAGVIVLDGEGNAGKAFNTEEMQTGVAGNV
ncbi:MAG: isoaspartyl peptidase/L-asparaginase, partial [Halobacteria archaeon]|nr:isoaspartyl peptidase/L-asparaginase [Halobacteria archaeon]